MIHSARPIVTPVANIVFCCYVFLDLKSGDGRTDGQHVRKEWSLPAMTLGWPSGSKYSFEEVLFSRYRFWEGEARSSVYSHCCFIFITITYVTWMTQYPVSFFIGHWLADKGDLIKKPAEKWREKHFLSILFNQIWRDKVKRILLACIFTVKDLSLKFIV